MRRGCDSQHTAASMVRLFGNLFNRDIDAGVHGIYGYYWYSSCRVLRFPLLHRVYHWL